MIITFKKWIINERLNNAEGRNMQKLVNYFEKSIEEKEDELPEFFQVNYPHIFDNWVYDNPDFFISVSNISKALSSSFFFILISLVIKIYN